MAELAGGLARCNGILNNRGCPSRVVLPELFVKIAQVLAPIRLGVKN